MRCPRLRGKKPNAPSLHPFPCHPRTHSCPGSSTAPPRADTSMALPTMALNNIYEAGNCIEETDSIMQGALGAQRMMRAAILRQKAMLIEKRERMTDDVRAGHTLPPATQRERLRLFELISSFIYWLEQTEEMLGNAIRVLDNPPRRTRQRLNYELTNSEGA